MKKSVKIISAIVIVLIAVAGIAMYVLQPKDLQTETVTKTNMEETLQLKGTVGTTDTKVVNATTTGTVKALLYTQGDRVKSGDELLKIDDTDYQNQVEDQIKLLQKQKSAVFTQGQSSQSEIKLRQQQLIAQIADLQHNYDLQFGDGGTAALDVKYAKAAMEGARSDCDTALDANSKASNAGILAPYSGTALGSLNYAYETAKANYMKAELMNTESNRQYYQDMIAAYQLQFDTLTENGNNGASSINLAAAQIQGSIDSLKREQNIEEMRATADGIVSEVLVLEGAFVAKNQPIMKISGNDYQLTTWMLTEDVLNYAVGDLVEVVIPDGTIIPGSIAFISPMAQEKLSSLGVEENRCEVKIEVENLPSQMGPGYEVDVNFNKTLRDSALTVPVSALVTENGSTCVYKVTGGKKVLTEVVTGIYSGGMVEITEGLSEGDEVVTVNE